MFFMYNYGSYYSNSLFHSYFQLKGFSSLTLGTWLLRVLAITNAEFIIIIIMHRLANVLDTSTSSYRFFSSSSPPHNDREIGMYGPLFFIPDKNF